MVEPIDYERVRPREVYGIRWWLSLIGAIVLYILIGAGIATIGWWHDNWF